MRWGDLYLHKAQVEEIVCVYIFLLFGLFMLLCFPPALHSIYFIRLCHDIAYMCWKCRYTPNNQTISSDYPPSGSGMTLVIQLMLQLQNSKGNIPQWGVKYNTLGVEKIVIFNWNCCLSQKLYEIGQWLLWNTNRKS